METEASDAKFQCLRVGGRLVLGRLLEAVLAKVERCTDVARFLFVPLVTQRHEMISIDVRALPDWRYTGQTDAPGEPEAALDTDL